MRSDDQLTEMTEWLLDQEEYGYGYKTLYYTQAFAGRCRLQFTINNGMKFVGAHGVAILTLGYSHGSTIGLDLTHGEIRDDVLSHIRLVIAAVLEKRGIQFVPVSMAALRNIRRTDTPLKLVDRDGLQCVFSLNRRYYISGYDANETPPLYFLARLPHRVKSYKEALEALKPESVKLAEERGLQVLRQGDIFFIPTTYTKRDLKKMGASFDTESEYEHRKIARPYTTQFVRDFKAEHGSLPRYYFDGDYRTVDRYGWVTFARKRKLGLYGTVHTASEIATIPGGTMFVRGTVEHDPRGVRGERRLADHHPFRLPGSRWYVAARNTVPLQ